MGSIISLILTPFVECLVVPINKQLSYLNSCRKYVRDMQTKMKDLNDTKSNVEKHELQNKKNSLEVPVGVPRWLDDVGEIDAQVKTIDSDVGSCFNLIGRHKHGRKAFNIIQNIDRLKENISGIDWTEIPIVQAEVKNASPSTPFSDYTNFESRKLIYEKALNALKADSKPHMIALCGMGGVGKTIMTKKLKKDVSEKAMFDIVIEVAVGADKNVLDIQKDIAQQLAIGLNETKKEDRAGKLRNGFKTEVDRGKKKFLVILDDIWKNVDLNDIGLSPKPYQGIDFKVLMTSRDKKVCIMMGVELDSILDLEVIEESEAQKFFFQFVSISDDVDLVKIGRDITIKCKGLPIAIKTIACALKYESKHVWEDTLTKLEHKDVREVAGEVFAISYKHLQDEETRLTLLLCGLYPEDFDTPVEDLMRYGWGLKMFKNVDTIREARNRLNTCITRLVHANLLIQSQEVGCVKMHDLVRAFVLDVCSKSERSSIIGNKWPTETNCKRISLTCAGMHDFPRNHNYPNLLLLKLMHGDKSLRFPEDFYEEKKKLKVIAYDKMGYPLHLRSLECSTNLRTLCLHRCSLMSDCSSIGNLSNLEVLSFAGSRIHELPSTIVNLKELKLLDLTDCKYLCIDDGILKSLVKLEELYMRGARRKVNAKGDELVEFLKNLEALEIEFFDKDALPQNLSFKNLERFNISLGCHLYKIDGLEERYSFENTLMLVANECELLDSGMNELFEKTKVLYLHVDGMNDIGDGLGASLHNLRVLHLHECTNLRYLFTFHVAKGLKQLESLKIDDCPVLETLVDSHEICEVIKFPSLKFLSLKYLPMLMSLCKGGNVIELPQLEELDLISLPNIISIHQHFLKEEVMSSKLKKLMIREMEKLKEIWPSELSNNGQVMISQLREIEVSGCDSLVNLFPSNPMSLLHHLEHISVKYCNSIDVLFNIDLGSSSSSYVGEIEEDSSSSNLRSIKVWCCGDLREVWRVKGVNNSNYHLSILGFRSVELIAITRCKRLRNVFTPTTSNFDMRSLKMITMCDIDDWGENKSINEEINVTSNQDISEVVDDDEIHNVAFPSYLIHTFHQLHTLELLYFRRAEVVFKIDSSSCRKLATTQNNQQLPHLKDLKLSNMERMTHVWKYDWNQFFVSQQEPKSSSFLNITSITLFSCHSIKYLFSPLMAKLLSNLTSIIIRGCFAMEEVVSNIDVEYEEMDAFISSHTNTTFFPHLETLNLWRLPCLKLIDGVGNNCGGKKLTSTITASSVYDKSQCYQVGGAYWSSYQYAKSIYIDRCDALLTLIPSHAVGHMINLEELKISYCKSMREIFESHEGVVKYNAAANIGDTIPRPIINMTLPNLKTLHIEGCHGLKYIFTSFVLESLKKLQELTVKDCSAIQMIVKQEDEGSSDTGSSTTKMTTLLELPNLKTLHISECHRLKYIFTSSVLENCLKKLKVLKIENCSGIQVIVKQEEHIIGLEDVVFPHLTSLTLAALPNLKGFFLGKNEFRWPVLDEVEMYRCPKMKIFTRGRSMTPKLKYIDTGVGKHSLECGLNFDWTDAPHEEEEDEGSSDTGSSTTKMTTLLELPNLKTLHISECHRLKYIFTSSVLENCLKKLKVLKIENCSGIQVIVKQEEHIIGLEDVVFPHLTSLTLAALPNLKGFFLGKNEFRWPVLDEVEMYRCPKMKIFTRGLSMTPKLKYIDTGVGKHSLECGLNFDWTDAPHEEENQLYNSSTAADLLQFPWSFSNLIEVNIGFLHGLSFIKTIFPSNELVNVGEGGDIEEADDKVFEDQTQSANNDHEIHHLSNKKQLRMSMDHPSTSSSYIWKINSPNLSNLTKVSLEGCHNLEHVFSYGMAATLVKLQNLYISSCSSMKVIVEAVQEDSANKVKVVSFPCLKSLQLTSLPSFKGFCLGSHDEANFEWPSLHTMEITRCPEMTVFTNGQSTTPKLKVIETSFGLCEVTEDLNSFIRTKKQEGYEF